MLNQFEGMLGHIERTYQDVPGIKKRFTTGINRVLESRVESNSFESPKNSLLWSQQGTPLILFGGSIEMRFKSGLFFRCLR